MTDDSPNAGVSQEQRLLDEIQVRDGWAVKWQGDTLVIDYVAVPVDRLKRKAPPGIEANYIGDMWMLCSHDSIGHGLEIEHQGILNHGKTVDCQHLDDAAKAVEHGMERIEEAVGDELLDGHRTRGWTHA